jgi:hypothetical protein
MLILIYKPARQFGFTTYLYDIERRGSHPSSFKLFKKN